MHYVTMTFRCLHQLQTKSQLGPRRQSFRLISDLIVRNHRHSIRQEFWHIFWQFLAYILTFERRWKWAAKWFFRVQSLILPGNLFRNIFHGKLSANDVTPEYSIDFKRISTIYPLSAIPFAELSRVEVVLSHGVVHMSRKTNSLHGLHGGFWCCSFLFPSSQHEKDFTRSEPVKCCTTCQVLNKGPYQWQKQSTLDTVIVHKKFVESRCCFTHLSPLILLTTAD